LGQVTTTQQQLSKFIRPSHDKRRGLIQWSNRHKFLTIQHHRDYEGSYELSNAYLDDDDDLSLEASNYLSSLFMNLLLHYLLHFT